MSQTITKTLQQTYFEELKKGGADWENLIEIGTAAVYNELVTSNVGGDLDRLWEISNKAFKSAVNAWVSGQQEFPVTQSPEDIANLDKVEQMPVSDAKDTLSEEYVREFQYKEKPNETEENTEEVFDYQLTQEDLDNNPAFVDQGLKVGDTVQLPKNPELKLEGISEGQTLTAADLDKYPELGEMGYKEGDTYTEQKDIDELLSEKDKSKSKKKKA